MLKPKANYILTTSKAKLVCRSFLTLFLY